MLKHASNRQPRRYQVIAAGGRRYASRAQALRAAHRIAAETKQPVRVYDRHRRQFLRPAQPAEAC